MVAYFELGYVWDQSSSISVASFVWIVGLDWLSAISFKQVTWLNQLLAIITITTLPWLVCLWYPLHQEVGCCLVLLHTEWFDHMLALYICGLHIMYYLGKFGENVLGLWGCKLAWKCWHINFCNPTQWSTHSSSNLQYPWIFCNILKSVQDMISVSIGKVFYTKIINEETKLFFFFFLYHQRPVEYLQGT